MITRLVIENFKSLRKVDLTLGRVNLFIGTNASGKSNFLEALRVLEGIANGFTISEIFNGKPKSSTSGLWEGIRGGSDHACFAGADQNGEVRIEAHGRREEAPFHDWMYRSVFFPAEGKLSAQQITAGNTTYEQDPGRPKPSYSSVASLANNLGLEYLMDLKNLKEDDGTLLALLVMRALTNAQHVDLTPEVLRSYAHYKQVERMGDHGENFAALVSVICQDPATKDAYLSWLRQLRPEEINDVGTLGGALGEPMFMLRENGREFTAPVLSDGTLRFAALTAAFFQPDMPDIMTIEEIENGIHSSRVQLLLDLLRSQAEAKPKPQIMATTHSATVLDWLREDDYRTTFLCTRDKATGESRLCCLADIPHFMDAVRKTPASELFSEGWLETAA